jgi:hypothetical protein
MFDAAPDRDLQLRDLASKTAREIVSIPPRALLEPLLRSRLPRFDVHIDGTSIDIVVQFEPVDVGHGQAAFIQKSKMIVLFVLPPASELRRMVTGGKSGNRALKRLFENDVPKVMREIASDIVHELTHALDILLRGAKIPATDVQSANSGEEGLRKYVSSPAEFNAFFQQSMYELEKELRQLKKNVLRDLTLQDFMRMMGKTRTYVERAPYLDEKYRRKWLSRAYQTYVHFIERLRDAG